MIIYRQEKKNRTVCKAFNNSRLYKGVDHGGEMKLMEIIKLNHFIVQEEISVCFHII